VPGQAHETTSQSQPCRRRDWSSPLGPAVWQLHGVYARVTAAAVDQYLLALAAGSQMTTCRGLLGQRREIGAVDCGCYVRETGVPGGYRAALDAGVQYVSGVSRRDGLGDLCPCLLCLRSDLMGRIRVTTPSEAPRVRRSAQHRPQRTPAEARERTGQYMDVSGWDGTRIIQNLRTWVSRSREAPQSGSGRSQS